MKNNSVTRGIIAVIFFVLVLIFMFFLFGVLLFNDRQWLIIFIGTIVLIAILLSIIKIISNLPNRDYDIEYIRNLPNKYSIPVIDFLYDYKIDLKRIIMTLKIKFENLNMNEEEICKLSISERYVYNMLNDENKEKYNLEELNSRIKIELEEKGLIDNKKPNVPLSALAIILFFGSGLFALAQIIFEIPLEIYDKVVGSAFIVFLIIICIIVPFISNPLEHSNFAKEEHKNILGFYKFLKDFTNLDKRSMQEYPLWKEYLECAILFGMNKNYRKDEEFKKLIHQEVFETLEEIGNERVDEVK